MHQVIIDTFISGGSLIVSCCALLYVITSMQARQSGCARAAWCCYYRMEWKALGLSTPTAGLVLSSFVGGYCVMTDCLYRLERFLQLVDSDAESQKQV